MPLKIFITVFILTICQGIVLSSVVPDNYDAKKPAIIKDILEHIPISKNIIYTAVPRGIILSVAQSELFDYEQRSLSSNGIILLSLIARMLNEFDNKCTIEVHTSEVKYMGSDWEESIILANVIAEYLHKNFRVDSDRLFPIGFGSVSPFKDNVSSTVAFPDNRIDFVIFDYTVSR